MSKLLEDEKKQLSDWEARLAFTEGFKSTVEVQYRHVILKSVCYHKLVLLLFYSDVPSYATDMSLFYIGA